MSAWKLSPAGKSNVSSDKLVHVIKFSLDMESLQYYVDLDHSK